MKTYCISDIHGHKDNFNSFVENLNDDDRVFVLGDVIDKGENSIEILLKIMYDHRFKMLLGNHEYMMYQFLSASEGSKRNEAGERWLDWNDGYLTYSQYQELDFKKQKEVYDYIANLPLNIPNLKIGNRTFYLVHSCPHNGTALTMKDVEYCDSIICSYVWDRFYSLNLLEVKDQIIIAGHTFVQEYLGMYTKNIKPICDFDKRKKIEDVDELHYVDIDGGLATNMQSSKLIVLCLDDLSYKLY